MGEWIAFVKASNVASKRSCPQVQSRRAGGGDEASPLTNVKDVVAVEVEEWLRPLQQRASEMQQLRAKGRRGREEVSPRSLVFVLWVQ